MPISVGAHQCTENKAQLPVTNQLTVWPQNLEANKDNAIKSDCEIAGGKVLSSYFQVWSKN